MDFAIQGIDVDCKYAQSLGEWMIPPEAMGHIILGLWASDERGRWSLGLIRVTEQVLSPSRGNRDLKRRLSASGKRQVAWIFRDQPFPENALLKPRHGTKRVDMLFRLAQRRLISRAVVATVAQQEGLRWVVAQEDDPPERAPLLPDI